MSDFDETKTIFDENSELVEVMNHLEEAIDNSDEFGIEFLETILSMDDKVVATIGQQLLWEIEKTLSTEESQMAIAKAIKMNAISAEDVAGTYQQIVEEVKNVDELSEIKKDFVVHLFGIIFNKMEEYSNALDQKVIIPIELIGETKLPTYAHEGDGAMDVYALDDYTIHPGETKLIPTGIKMAIPQGYGILVQPRSGLSLKSKLRIANTPGLIDSGYRDEIGIIVENIAPRIKDITTEWDAERQCLNVTSVDYGSDEFITKGERFAQLRLVKIPTAFLQPVENVREIGDDRGGGFGSSGIL